MPNKVLLLLADGMRPDALPANDPFVDAFLQGSAHTLNGRTVMPSVTLPCHMSLFHSVPPQRHGILTNTWVPQVRPVRGLVETLRAAGKRCGFFYDWEELRDLSRPGHLAQAFYLRGDEYSYEHTMTRVTQSVVACLGGDAPDFVFVYFGLPDAVGHDTGFSGPAYETSVQRAWRHIQIIREALPADYGMAVTADHGGHERGHGTDCSEDMTIPIILHGAAFLGIDAQRIKTASILDIAPTIARAMGVDADRDWEGESLFA